MNENNQSTKLFTPLECPHCKKTFFTSLHVPYPIFGGLLTKEEIKKIKEELIKRLDEINFVSEEIKQKNIDIINNKQSIYEYADIEPIIKQISINQTNAKSKTNTTE